MRSELPRNNTVTWDTAYSTNRRGI